MCTSCNGGKGTSGQGRTSYTPQKKSAIAWPQQRKVSAGGKSTDSRASQFGKPAVRASFGKK